MHSKWKVEKKENHIFKILFLFLFKYAIIKLYFNNPYVMVQGNSAWCV